MNIIDWVIDLAVIFLAIQYLIGPILVYFVQKMPDRYKFKLLNPDNFLSERGEIFKSLHTEISENGFKYVGSAELIVNNCSMFFSIYYSSSRMLTCTLTTAQTKQTTTTQFEFTQLYADGTLFGVNNNPIFNVYPKWEIKEGYRYPNINSFHDLLDVTEKLILKLKSSSQPKPMIEGQEFSIIEDHLNNELDHLIEIGLVSSHVTNNKRRLTAKGALLMTWKLCWPIKSIINKIDISRSTNVLKNA